jgi:hypothetical protein
MSTKTTTMPPAQLLLNAESLLAVLEVALCDTEADSAPDPAHVRVVLGQVRRSILDAANRLDGTQGGAK